MRPVFRGFRFCVDGSVVVVCHVGDCLPDPVSGFVDYYGDVREGGLRAGDHEEVGEGGDCDLWRVVSVALIRVVELDNFAI